MPQTSATASSKRSLTAFVPLKLDAHILARALRFWGERIFTDPGEGVGLGHVYKQAHWPTSSMAALLGQSTRAASLMELSPIFGLSSPWHGADCLGGSVVTLPEAFAAGGAGGVRGGGERQVASSNRIACSWLLLAPCDSLPSTHSPAATPVGPSASTRPVIKVSGGGIVLVRAGEGIVRVHHLRGLLLLRAGFQMSSVLGGRGAAIDGSCTDGRHVHVVAAGSAVGATAVHPGPS